jgi:hypothetical protein
MHESSGGNNELVTLWQCPTGSSELLMRCICGIEHHHGRSKMRCFPNTHSMHHEFEVLQARLCQRRRIVQSHTFYASKSIMQHRLFRGPNTNDMKNRMVLAAPGLLLTPPPSSSPPKTPHRSYSAQIQSQNEEKTPPPPNRTCPYRRELDIHDHTDPIRCAK